MGGRKGKLQDAMSCLEEIYNDCASDKNVEGNPGFMLNVGKWRRAMQSVCDNIDCEYDCSAFVHPVSMLIDLNTVNVISQHCRNNMHIKLQ